MQTLFLQEAVNEVISQNGVFSSLDNPNKRPRLVYALEIFISAL